MKTAPKKAPGKPQAPKKPSTRSKTGNSACSQAASNWQLAIRGKAPLDPDTYKTLGKCRAMARSAKSADDRADMGYNLSEQGRTALKGRLQKRFDQGLITQKSRQDRLKTLLAQRKEKQASVTAKPAPAPAKFSRGGQLAPGRGTVERAIVANALITGRKPAQIKGEYENAGNNVIVNPAATPRERVKQKKLVALLNTYERSYAGQWNLPKPPKRDEHAHGAALLASGLTGDGLMRARSIAGKYATGKPGIIAVKPPAPATAPAPAKFSRGGQLAPGRGTEERKLVADTLKSVPKNVRNSYIINKQFGKIRDQQRKAGNTNFGTDLHVGGLPSREIQSGFGELARLRMGKLRSNENAENTKSVAINMIKSGGEKLRKFLAPAPAKRENEPPPSPPKPRFEPRKVYATNTQLPSSMGGMKKGYVAEIKGTHPKYKLDRQFLQGRNDGAGTEYTITQRGIYETQTEESKGRAMRTYVFHGRKKTRELLPPGGYSSPTMPSVDRAVNLLELFRKKR